MGAGQPDAGVVDGQHRSNVPAQGGPGPDRLAVRRCLPDCRNAGYRVDRTLTGSATRRTPPEPFPTLWGTSWYGLSWHPY